MPKNALSAFLSVLALIVSLENVSWAQDVRATIGGRVTDAQGAVVPGAIVRVISDDTAVKQETQTNPQGNWGHFVSPAGALPLFGGKRRIQDLGSRRDRAPGRR